MQPDPTASFRMINACACGRQYDVSHLGAGALVLCECGQSFSVEYHQPRSPRALRCSSCGANLKRAARSCEFCSAEVTLEERRLSAVCPKCWARASTEASFCMECGIKIEVQSLTALPAGTTCPRCRGALRSRVLGTASVVECGACGGMWLGSEHFDRLCEQEDESELASRGLQRQEPKAQVDTSEVRYLPCVVCGDFMQRRNYAQSSGVVIDICRQHGVWLDQRELSRILEFVRKGGLDRARQRQIERLESQERRARNAGSMSLPPEMLNPHRPYHRGGLELFDWVTSLIGILR